MAPLIKQNLPTIKNLFRKYNTERAFLFGSAAKGNFNNNSDVDFLFSFPQSMDYELYFNSYFNLLSELENLLKRDVELVAEKTLKNPFLIESIEESKIQLL